MDICWRAGRCGTNTGFFTILLLSVHHGVLALGLQDSCMAARYWRVQLQAPLACVICPYLARLLVLWCLIAIFRQEVSNVGWPAQHGHTAVPAAAAVCTVSGCWGTNVEDCCSYDPAPEYITLVSKKASEPADLLSRAWPACSAAVRVLGAR